MSIGFWNKFEIFLRAWKPLILCGFSGFWNLKWDFWEFRKHRNLKWDFCEKPGLPIFNWDFCGFSKCRFFNWDFCGIPKVRNFNWDFCEFRKIPVKAVNASIRFYGIGLLWVSSASDGPVTALRIRRRRPGTADRRAAAYGRPAQFFVLIASGTIASQHTEGSCTAFMDRMRLCFPHTSAPGWQNGIVTDAHSIHITSTQRSAGTILHSRPTACQQKTPAPYPAPYPAPDLHCIHI